MKKHWLMSLGLVMALEGHNQFTATRASMLHPLRHRDQLNRGHHQGFAPIARGLGRLLIRSTVTPITCLSLVCLLSVAFPARAADESWRLVGAAKAGDEQLIRRLLDTGADPRGQAGSEAVAEAAKNGRAKALEILLSRGASADADDGGNFHSTPRRAITLAAEAGS